MRRRAECVANNKRRFQKVTPIAKLINIPFNPFRAQHHRAIPHEETSMKFRSILRIASPAAAIAALLAACSSQPPAPIAHAPQPSPAQSSGEIAAPMVAQPSAASAHTQVSHASSPRAYRADAASHIYAKNSERIYKGKLPPLLYAIGVLQVDVDSRGNVRSLNWMRAPSHAPEVVAEIERTVRAAAPFPVPANMGRVTYTDTWLWHKSGRFQLDTLTEGQL
jgi:protein TonB